MSLWYLAAGFLQAQNNNLKQHSMIMNSISKLLKIRDILSRFSTEEIMLILEKVFSVN